MSRRSEGTNSWLAWAAPLAVCAATIACFLPALGNGLLLLDDRWNLLENPYFRGLGWEQLRWMFTTIHHFGNYEPMTWLVFALTYSAWGIGPWGYHLTGLLLHAAVALAFYFVAKRLLRLALESSASENSLRVGAAFAALFFSVHPLRVESVVWASAQHYSLAGLFYLLSIEAYLRGRRWLAASLGLYVLSLLSFTVGIMLPVVLLILDVYPLKRLEAWGQWSRPEGRKILLEKAPFFLAAAAASIVQVLARNAHNSVMSLARHSAQARLSQMFYGLAFYVRKTLFPLRLHPYYRIPDNFDPWTPPFVLSAAAVILAAALLLAARRRRPWALAATACYAAGLLPVLGIVQVGRQLVADRYSYLPCLAWAVLAGAALARAWAQPRLRLPAAVMALGVTAALASLTWGQIGIWKDDVRLWEHTLALEPDRYDVQYNLAYALAARGRLGEAEAHYRVAVKFNGEDMRSRVNLGNVLLALHRPAEAAQEFEIVLQAHPQNIPSRYDLGLALLEQGKAPDALVQFRELLKLSPQDPRALAMVSALERSLRQAPAAMRWSR